MPTQAALLAVLMVGTPAALLAGWLGWRGVAVVWAVLGNAVWPMVGAALWLTFTNSAEGPYRLDAPVVAGAMLGSTFSTLSAPLWLGGFWVGRRTRQVRRG